MKAETRKLLKLTRRRIKSLSLRKTLKDNLSRSIAKNASDYLHGAITLGNLPVQLRKQVLSELTALECNKLEGEGQKHYKKLAKATSLLICQHTKIFELGGLMSFCSQSAIPKNTSKIVKMIVSKAPNLEQLDLNINSKFDGNQALDMGIPSLHLIANMEKLKILKITNYKISYGNVKFVCRNLKNLLFAEFRFMQFPTIKLLVLDEDIDDIKKSFSHLKVFLFSSATKIQTVEARFEKLKLLCVKHLPNLKAIHQFENTSKSGFAIRASSIPAETSALEHLCAEPGNFDLHKTFPNVTHLKVVWKPHNIQIFDNLLQFKSIECLNIYELPSTSSVNVFLKTYGLNLHTLIIYLGYTCVQTGISFKSIFAACPKLETLHLHNVKITDDREQIECFAKLREFHWNYDSRPVELFHVTNILSAPELDKISLGNGVSLFDMKNLQRLTSMIADKKILLKLTHFKLHAGLFIKYNDANINNLYTLSSLVDHAAAFLPYLVDITFDIGVLDFNEWVDLQLFEIDNDKQISGISESGKKFCKWVRDGYIYRFFCE